MLKFLKYFGLAFAVQIVLLVVFLILLNKFEITMPPKIEEAVAYFLLWPALLLPQGKGHGGELFLTPITFFIHSLLFATIMLIWKRSSTNR